MQHLVSIHTLPKDAALGVASRRSLREQPLRFAPGRYMSTFMHSMGHATSTNVGCMLYMGLYLRQHYLPPVLDGTAVELHCVGAHVVVIEFQS